MLDPSAVERTPWPNGAGSTRELAVSTGPDGSTTWRVSVADLDRDGPFSLFPELDRVFVALGPLRLTVDGVTSPMAAGDQTSFPGEAAVSVAVDEPTTALNVMARRGRCRAEVVLRHPGEDPADGADASVRLSDRVADIRLHLMTEDLA
ncbi:MAG: HutD family protein [Aeromicrobium sp.]